MNWMSLLIGSFFILMGVSMILRMFGIDLPITRVIFALFLISIGVRMLLPKHSFCRESTDGGEATTFRSSRSAKTDSSSAEYSVAFGSKAIDLTRVDLSKGDVRVKVSVAFGQAEVAVDPKMPLKISGSSAFGNVDLPGGNSAVFGTASYKSDAYKEGSPALLIEASSAFGAIEIK